MNGLLFMLLLASLIIGSECRSVSVAFSHRERFEVKDEPERGYIELPGGIIELLHLDQPSVEDELEAQLHQQAHSHPVARLEAYSAADYVTKAGSEDMGPISDGDDEDDDSGNDDNNETLDDRYGGNYDERDDEDDWNGYADRKNTQDLKKDYDLKVENDAEFIFDNDNNNVKSDVSNSLHKIYDRIDVDVDDAMIDDEAQLKRHIRSKRASGVNEQWRQSLPGYRRVHQHNEDDMEWQEVTDKDLRRAKYGEFSNTAKYVGLTLLSVMCFVFLGYCFIRDPVAFVFAFGTGCPCCIICCPCIQKFTDKYLNVKKIIKDSMNRYMPGMIIKDDGTFDTYEPTPDELDIMAEIMDEIM